MTKDEINFLDRKIDALQKQVAELEKKRDKLVRDEDDPMDRKIKKYIGGNKTNKKSGVIKKKPDSDYRYSSCGRSGGSCGGPGY